MLGACAPIVTQTPSPVSEPIPAQRHAQVFDAAVDVLRSADYVVDFEDRSRGLIRARPGVIPTVFEPWRSHAAMNPDLAWQSTANFQRRCISIHLDPVEAPVAGTPASHYVLRVESVIERRQHPPRPVSSSAVIGRGRGTVSIMTERGIETSFWRPIGREPDLEHALTQRILKAAAPSGLKDAS